jgi:4-amino-4-deoxy-L-arabinose transferase-like glycosyltransferase
LASLERAADRLRPQLPWLGAAAAFWALAAAALSYRLGDFPLKDFDEAIYAEVAREMLRTGDLLTLHYNHEPFFDKPPLYFWASQLVIRLLGFSEATSRLPGVLFGALTLWVTSRWGRELGGGVAGLTSGAMLLSTAMFLENGSRHATHDSLLLFLTAAALWSQWRARRAPGLRYVVVGLLGLAVLTKGAAALPLFLTLALLHWLLGDHRSWTTATYIRGALLLGVIVAPWYAVETVRHGMAFWHQHVGVMVWERATRTGFHQSRGPLYYTRFLVDQLSYLWPVGLLALWAGVEARAWRVRPALGVLGVHRETVLTLSLATVVPIVLFSAARNQIWWYILPSVPPLCLAGGLVIEAARRRLTRDPWRRGLYWTLVGLLLASAAWHVRGTLVLQVRNGIVLFGPQARLAQQAVAHAAALGLRDPVMFFPRPSPSVAVYVPFRVVFDAEYAARLGDAPVLHGGADGALVLDKQAALRPLVARARVTILEEAGGWALAVVRPGED